MDRRMPGRPTEFKIVRPHPEMPANLESASTKADRIKKKHALNPRSFIGKNDVTSFSVYQDMLELKNKEITFEEPNIEKRRLGKSFEAAIFERVNKSQWLGERVHMIMCSEYDDVINYVDGVLEFQEDKGGRSHMGLAIDVTYNNDPKKKFEGIARKIRSGKMSKVKYFRSSDGKHERPLENLPQAVVVLNEADASRVVRDWDEDAPQQGTDFRKIILLQLEIQLKAYLDYALRLEAADKRRPVISKYFAMTLRNISALMAEIVKHEELEQLNNHPSIKMVEEQLRQLGLQENQSALAA